MMRMTRMSRSVLAEPELCADDAGAILPCALVDGSVMSLCVHAA